MQAFLIPGPEALCHICSQLPSYWELSTWSLPGTIFENGSHLATLEEKWAVLLAGLG